MIAVDSVELTVVMDARLVDGLYVNGHLVKTGEAVDVVDLIRAAAGRMIKLNAVTIDGWHRSWPSTLREALEKK